MDVTSKLKSGLLSSAEAAGVAEVASRSAGRAGRFQAVAEMLESLVGTVVGVPLPARFEFWDGSAIGPSDGAGVVRVHSPDALRRLMWSPSQLGAARAYVAGDLDVEGDLFSVFRSLRHIAPANRRFWLQLAPAALRAAHRLGVLGRPLPSPPEEARVGGRRHSYQRDADAISHHYDVGNDFYRLVLGPALTYSCARYSRPGMSLADAQGEKHELICQKLGLHHRPGARLLDVGCGWGSFALHAAARHDVSVVGITISQAQADLARKRVAEAGLGERVEIRVQDYRDLGSERFDAIASVGMSEHVGTSRTAQYFARLRAVLAPQGRLLNHAISSPGGSALGGDRSFMRRYVFPDGELLDVAAVVAAMEAAGFEVRDVESLREHYAHTLRAWVHNLEENWERAVELAGAARTKIWRLYMVGSAVGFEAGQISLHQVLGVAPTNEGASGMPQRRDWD